MCFIDALQLRTNVIIVDGAPYIPRGRLALKIKLASLIITKRSHPAVANGLLRFLTHDSDRQWLGNNTNTLNIRSFSFRIIDFVNFTNVLQDYFTQLETDCETI